MATHVQDNNHNQRVALTNQNQLWITAMLVNSVVEWVIIYVYDIYIYVCVCMYVYGIWHCKVVGSSFKIFHSSTQGIPRKNVPNEARGTVPNCHWKDIGCYESMQICDMHKSNQIHKPYKPQIGAGLQIRVGPPVLGSTAVDGKKQTLQQTLSWTPPTPNLNVSARVTKSGLSILSIGAITHFSSQ